MYGLPPAAVVLAAVIAKALPAWSLERAESALSSRRAPIVLGALSALVILIVFDSLRQVGVVHDERAYLLQSEIFASGHWVAPSPPLPAFFEQMHVFVTPVVASKYPPGHSLILLPGTLIGLPGLIPVVLTGLAGGLIFALVRRISDTWIALLTWFLWTTAPGTLAWHATYMSEPTTAAAMLLAWWGLLEWRDTRRVGALLVTAASVGFGAITRPLTMLAIGVPIAVVVLRLTIAGREWRPLVRAAAVGAAMLALLPLHAYETTGNWRQMPITTYTQIYMPWERLGFGDVAESPTRALPPDLAAVANGFRGLHQGYVPSEVPGSLRERSLHIATDVWGHQWRAGLILFFGIGLFALSTEAAFALASALLVLVVYLAYAQGPGWTVYYVEMLPALCLVTALGIGRTIGWISGAGVDASEARRRLGVAAILLVAAGVLPAILDIIEERDNKREWTLRHRYFREVINQIPAPRALVFVRYAPHHSGHISLVGNVADPTAAHVLTAYDLGPADTQLMQRLPDRVPYLFEEEKLELFPLGRATASALSPPNRDR